jgi:hypothetical protein
VVADVVHACPPESALPSFGGIRMTLVVEHLLGAHRQHASRQRGQWPATQGTAAADASGRRLLGRRPDDEGGPRWPARATGAAAGRSACPVPLGRDRLRLDTLAAPLDHQPQAHQGRPARTWGDGQAALLKGAS